MKRIFAARTKKVIFFDFNRTLVDHKHTRHSSFIEAFQEFTGRWDPAEGVLQPEELAVEYEKKLSRARARQSAKKTKQSLSQLRLTCLRSTLQAYPALSNDDFLQSFIKRKQQLQTQQIKLYPQTKQILTELHKRYRLAIISNRGQLQLQSLNLHRLIPESHVITAQNAKHRKPHPAIFKYALNKMKVKPSEAVMIGDNWKTDIVGATRAGIDAVWIKHAAKTHYRQRKLGQQRVVILRDLKQVLQLFGH